MKKKQKSNRWGEPHCRGEECLSLCPRREGSRVHRPYPGRDRCEGDPREGGHVAKRILAGVRRE